MTTLNEGNAMNSESIRLRSDGRYEARYVKGRDADGKRKYGSCYGSTYEEAKEKRDALLKIQLRNKGLNLLILGAGSHGMDVYEIAKSLRIFSKINFLDDASDNPNVIGKWKDVNKFLDDYPVAFVAVGDEDLRRTWTDTLMEIGFSIPILIHPTAFVPESTEIGPGTVICARATLSAGVRLGRGALVGTGALVPRNTKIPDFGYFDLDKLIMGFHNRNLD